MEWPLSSQRKKMGLTQVQLSALSGVSLPTIQNIEAGKGNPSYEVLVALLKSLGLELRFERQGVDWEYLITLGLPLASSTSKQGGILDISQSMTQIRQACLEATEKRDSRTTEALCAFLLAIKRHYPSWFTAHLAGIPLVTQVLEIPLTGRIIKLSRQALERISKWL